MVTCALVLVCPITTTQARAGPMSSRTSRRFPRRRPSTPISRRPPRCAFVCDLHGWLVACRLTPHPFCLVQQAPREEDNNRRGGRNQRSNGGNRGGNRGGSRTIEVVGADAYGNLPRGPSRFALVLLEVCCCCCRHRRCRCCGYCRTRCGWSWHDVP